MKEQLEDLDEALEDATLRLHEAVLAMDPLEAMSKVNTWHWRTVQEAHEEVVQVIERGEQALKEMEGSAAPSRECHTTYSGVR